jgi:hypothetical protein
MCRVVTVDHSVNVSVEEVEAVEQKVGGSEKRKVKTGGENGRKGQKNSWGERKESGAREG